MALFHHDKTVLYMNIHIIDVVEAVKDQVSQKIAKSNLLPPPIRKWAAQSAPNLLPTDMVAKPSVVVEKMGAKLCRKVPRKMKEKGLQAVIEEVFREGPLVVFQLQIQHVDAMHLIRSSGETIPPEETNKQSVFARILLLFAWFFRMIGVKGQRSIEEEFLPRLIHLKLESALNEVIVEKLESKKVVADTMVLPEAKQARYFYEKLRQVREANKPKQGPIRKALSARKKSKDSEDMTDSSDEEEEDDNVMTPSTASTAEKKQM